MGLTFGRICRHSTHPPIFTVLSLPSPFALRSLQSGRAPPAPPPLPGAPPPHPLLRTLFKAVEHPLCLHHCPVPHCNDAEVVFGSVAHAGGACDGFLQVAGLRDVWNQEVWSGMVVGWKGSRGKCGTYTRGIVRGEERIALGREYSHLCEEPARDRL